MSGLDPKGPSQPSLDQAYTTPGNPAQKDPKEQVQTEFNAADNSASVDQRIPTKQATDAEGLRNAKFEEGMGVHGAPAGEERKGLGHEDVGRHKELDGQQMAAPGEGRETSSLVCSPMKPKKSDGVIYEGTASMHRVVQSSSLNSLLAPSTSSYSPGVSCPSR